MPQFLAAVLFLVGLGVAGFVWAFGKREVLLRKLTQAKTWRLADLPEDTLGKVIGRTRPLGGTLTAPISGRVCLFYEVTVEQETGRSRSSSTIIHELQGVPFYLEDGTGRAIVDPSGADVVLTQDFSTTSGTLDDATPVEYAFLRRHGQEPKFWLFNKHFTFRESIISVGEAIAVLGAGVREPDPEVAPTSGYRGAMPTRVRLTSARDHKLTISDLPATTTQLS